MSAAGSLIVGLFEALRALLLLVARKTFGKQRSLTLLFLAFLLIPTWQRRFLTPEVPIANTYANFASTGVHSEPKFFFFLRHLGLYPLMTVAPILSDTKEEAERQLRENGADLRVDEGVTFRSGDRGRIYLYWLDLLMRHDATAPSLHWPNAIGYSAALCVLFAGFWWIQRSWMGVGVILFLGSNPAQLYSTYKQENVFGWSVTIALVLMGIHLPFMTRRPPNARWVWALPVVAGLLLASGRTVRSEGVLIAGTVLLVYLTLAGAAWKKRVILAATFLVTMSLGTYGYGKFFEHKFRVAHSAMVKAGGTPYTGPLPIYHEVWHAVYCGLGDYDTTHGYRWDDRIAYAYALPILTGRYGLQLPPWQPGWYTFDATYDGTGKYPIFFSEVAHYHDIIREKVVGDIKQEPRWYLDILRKRARRILAETPPIAVHLGDKEPLFSLTSAIGFLCVPLALFLALARRGELLKILLFTTPLSAPALIIYSDRGMTYYSTFHYFGAAILCAMAAEGAKVWLKRSSTS